MRKGELEARLLILVTLGLVAFGLVMVYSASSAPAALGGGNPMGYLERQGTYALLGVALMVLGGSWRPGSCSPPLCSASPCSGSARR